MAAMCTSRVAGLSSLISSDLQLLSRELHFLLDIPLAIEPELVLEHVANVLEGGYDDAESVDSYRITMNRFASPDIWIESVMQQLSVFREHMDELALGVTYGTIHVHHESYWILMVPILCVLQTTSRAWGPAPSRSSSRCVCCSSLRRPSPPTPPTRI